MPIDTGFTSIGLILEAGTPIVEGGNERVKVIDFGVAKLLALAGDAARSSSFTASGAMLGTQQSS